MRQFNCKASRLIDLCLTNEERGHRLYRWLRCLLEKLFI